MQNTDLDVRFIGLSSNAYYCAGIRRRTNVINYIRIGQKSQCECPAGMTFF